MPKRIQLKRTKGWKLPPNTVNVARPGKWGNPYTIAEYGRELAVRNFRNKMEGLIAIRTIDLRALRGKDIACWCKLEDSCHGDILLSLANEEPT